MLVHQDLMGQASQNASVEIGVESHLGTTPGAGERSMMLLAGTLPLLGAFPAQRDNNRSGLVPPADWT